MLIPFLYTNSQGRPIRTSYKKMGAILAVVIFRVLVDYYLSLGKEYYVNLRTNSRLILSVTYIPLTNLRQLLVNGISRYDYFRKECFGFNLRRAN